MKTIDHLDLGGTMGVGYLGVVFTSVIYGITCIQSFQYYRSPRAKTDIALIKYLVLTVWYYPAICRINAIPLRTLCRILDTVQEIFAVHAFYFWLVDNFDNPMSILVTVWSVPAGILVNAFISCSVKLFFLIRIWKLSGNVYVTIAGAIMNLVRFVMNLYYPIRTFCVLNMEDIRIEELLKPFGSSGLASEVACNLLISVCMTYYLQRGRRTALRRSGDMISRLILLTVATGTLSSLIAAAGLIAYLASPDTLYVLFFILLIAKVDANALLTSLNSRQFIRDGSGPNVVCISTEQKAIPWQFSTNDSSEECGVAGS